MQAKRKHSLSKARTTEIANRKGVGILKNKRSRENSLSMKNREKQNHDKIIQMNF